MAVITAFASSDRPAWRKKTKTGSRNVPLVSRLVVAGLAAGLAVQQPVGAEADALLGLAEDAVFLAPAACLRLLAVGTDDPAHGWF